jgi:cytochrome c biogenesis protein CcmG, thiol:disulfide interchange protein DsbE
MHNQKLFLRLAIALVGIGLAGCRQHPASSIETKTAVNAGEIGSRLPDFSTKDLNGRDISSGDLRGKVAIIDFWATWCQPCKKEMPGYQKLLDRYGPRGFAVVGLKATMMMDTEDPLRFAQEAGVHYPLAIATPRITDQFGGILGLPTTLIYDRGGVLRQKIVGFEYTNVVEAEIKSLLGSN